MLDVWGEMLVELEERVKETRTRIRELRDKLVGAPDADMDLFVTRTQELTMLSEALDMLLDRALKVAQIRQAYLVENPSGDASR
jgi:chromosome condensin MukBEF complex kleisin-like MukF subunit